MGQGFKPVRGLAACTDRKKVVPNGVPRQTGKITTPRGAIVMSNAKRSLTAELLAEQKRIEEGGSPEKRNKGTSVVLLEFARSEDSVVEEEEEQPVNYEFVEGDDEGDELFLEKKKKKGNPRKRGPGSLGPSPKIPTNYKADETGDWLAAEDGKVLINLHKAILRQLTEEDLLSKEYKNRVDSKGKTLTTSHWECRMWSKTASSDHPRFISVGENTGNLKKHNEKYHEVLLESLARTVAETPASEAKDSITRYIEGVAPPIGALDKLFARKAGPQQIAQETACLIWFLDAQIPFSQLDSEYFKAFMGAMSSKVSSSVTIVGSLLPALYTYCVGEVRGFLGRCSSFVNSWDGWSRGGQKFVSQHYHAITMDTFEYRVALLDFIPYFGPQYAENLAGALATRRAHWTEGTGLIVSGGMADAESKVQAAGKLMFGKADMQRCQNHRLKKVYEVGEARSNVYQKDFKVLAALASGAAANGAIDEALGRFQRLNDLQELSFILFNDTRWEGRYRALERIVKLKEALIVNNDILHSPLVLEQKMDIVDFLTEDYFVRLESYLPIMERMNRVSEFYQTQRFPVGCFVPIMTKYLECVTRPKPQMEAAFLTDFKSAMHSAVKEYLSKPVFKEVNNFLKASILHPGVASVVKSFVDEDVFEACIASIKEDALTLDEDCGPFFDPAIQHYLDKVVGVKQEFDENFSWDELQQNGKFRGVSHLDYWHTVAEGKDRKVGNLVGCAAMLLTLPAGESIDEGSFSSSQRTLSKERSTLLPVTVEQITIIRMFIRSFGLTPNHVDSWIKTQMMNVKEETKTKKLKAQQSAIKTL